MTKDAPHFEDVVRRWSDYIARPSIPIIAKHENDAAAREELLLQAVLGLWADYRVIKGGRIDPETK